MPQMNLSKKAISFCLTSGQGDAPVKGRIPRSIPITYEQLEERIDDIPRNAPVILYSDNSEDVLDAYEDLKDEGFNTVAMVIGNYQGWVASAGKSSRDRFLQTKSPGSASWAKAKSRLTSSEKRYSVNCPTPMLSTPALLKKLQNWGFSPIPSISRSMKFPSG